MTIRIRRLLAAIASVLALALAATACAGPSTSETSGTSGDGTPEGTEPVSATLTVSVAASLAAVAEELTVAFTADHPGITFAPTVSGGSPELVTQVLDGAPVDVLILASTAASTPLTDAGLDISPVPIATNTMRIAVPAGNPRGVLTLADLARPELRISLCAANVPCGAAAAKLLELAGVTLTGASEESNVAAVVTRVTTGEADAGLVYATDIAASGGALEGIVPEHVDEATTTATATVLSESEAAAAFVAFLGSERAQEILAAAGFGAP